MSDSQEILNVLLVSGGGFQGLALIKGLLQAERVRVVVADCFAENVTRYFAHRSLVVPPLAQEEAFVSALRKICRDEDIGVIFPCTEHELDCLARHAAEFDAVGARVAVSRQDLLGRLCNKEDLYALLKEEGLPGPALVDIASDSVAWPLLGKPRKGWGGRGHVVLHTREALLTRPMVEWKKDYLWQAFLTGFVEYSVDFAIDFAGAVSELCLRERLRVSGGFAVVNRYEEEAQVRDLAGRFASAAVRRGGKGIFNLQILRADGRYFISDVNPRIGTSAAGDHAVGVNLPLFVCGTASGRQRVSPRASRPVTMVRYLEELLVVEELLMEVRGLVFDLDDTLMNQKHWIVGKLRGLHAQFKSRLPPESEFLASGLMIVEEGNRARLIDAMAEKFGWSGNLKSELIGAYRQITPAARVYVDVWPALAELRRRGYRLAILTNNPPESQRQKLQACGMQDTFAAVVYAAELEAEKPAVRGFTEVAARLGVPPRELVMIGDHLYRDVAGALKAGYRHAFLMVREGGFFNFDVEIGQELAGIEQRFTRISQLRDLLRYLRGAP